MFRICKLTRGSAWYLPFFTTINARRLDRYYLIRWKSRRVSPTMYKYRRRVPNLIRHICHPCLYRAHGRVWRHKTFGAIRGAHTLPNVGHFWTLPPCPKRRNALDSTASLRRRNCALLVGDSGESPTSRPHVAFRLAWMLLFIVIAMRAPDGFTVGVTCALSATSDHPLNRVHLPIEWRSRLRFFTQYEDC